MSAFHLLSPLGLLAMPVAPVGEAGALAIREFDATEGFAFLCNDVRTEHQLPELSPGATVLHDTGAFRGDPYLFTVTLDPKDKAATIESHRAGGKIVFKNKEGVSVEIAGTTVKIAGATSVTCGGEEQLTKLQPLLTVLTDIQTAMTALAAVSCRWIPAAAKLLSAS